MLLYVQLPLVALIWFLAVPLGKDAGFFLTIPWWDVLLHTLGGIWIALSTVWLLLVSGRKFSVLQCALAALAIGIGWEIFEYINHIGGSVFMPYWVDTIKDLLDDTMGGILGGIFLKNLVRLWRK